MSPAASPVTPSQVLSIVFRYPGRWLLPAIVLSAVAGTYAMIHTPKWEASQALIVRNEAASDQAGPGRFHYPEEMKTLQETILELVKGNSVLSAALKQVGAPAGYRGIRSEWPTAEDVAELRDVVKLVPPNGAEFGKTEVFYLKVQDRDRQRAVALAAAICSQLEVGFQQLRDAKARSMIEELVKAANLAKADLAEATGRLTATETQVGSDLAELRILHEAGSGESALRRTITEICNELRQVRAAATSNRQLSTLLKEIQADPNRLVAIPNQLIESQPALRRLKEGLAEAQLRTAQLSGGMSELHPQVRAARESEREIGHSLRQELVTAIRGVEIDLRLNTDRLALLEDQLAKTSQRLNRLSALRAPYANQVAETRNRAALLERAEQRLSEARASEATAKAASLITRIDEPDAGIAPVGPGRATIAMGGIAGGLLAGLGVLLLTVQPIPSAPGFPAAGPLTASHGDVKRNGAANHESASANGLSLNEALRKIDRFSPNGADRWDAAVRRSV